MFLPQQKPKKTAAPEAPCLTQGAARGIDDKRPTEWVVLENIYWHLCNQVGYACGAGKIDADQDV